MSSRIGIGFVGAGWMGGAQLQRLARRPDVEVLALYEKNRERGLDVLKTAGLPETILVDDYQAILDNPRVTAVWVVSPNRFHGPQSIAALQAGKHVFCEKPTSTVFAEHLRQLDLERQTGLLTYVDYILYFDTMEQRLRRMVAEGAFGDITQLQVNYRHPVNIVGDKVWKLERAVMGDAIGMGINHALSVMVFLMASQGMPCAVYATSQPARVRGFEADPIWSIVVRFTGGATGYCAGNIDFGNGYDAYHNVHGTKGAFVFDSQTERTHKVRYWSEPLTQGRWIHPLDPERCRTEGVSALAWPEDTTTPDSGNVIEHQIGACLDHFINCIRSGHPSPLSFGNARSVADIGWAAQMSAALGREIALPLDRAQATDFFG